MAATKAGHAAVARCCRYCDCVGGVVPGDALGDSPVVPGDVPDPGVALLSGGVVVEPAAPDSVPVVPGLVVVAESVAVEPAGGVVPGVPAALSAGGADVVPVVSPAPVSA